MTHLELALFAVGLAALTAGAESLVRGGSRLAASVRVSPLVIGLTVVSFGTSTPELVVSFVAAAEGDATLAVGNVVGSNIFNVVGILGVTALVAPLAVAAAVVRREIPIMIGASVLFVLLALDGTVSLFEGVLLLSGIVIYVVVAYRGSRQESPEVVEEFEAELGLAKTHRIGVDVLLIAAGLALLVVGGRLVVSSAVAIAEEFGVSERVVALTLVAAGTSLPELATSLVAAFRKHADIAVGNVVGSNIFNLFAIGGGAAVLTPLEVLPAVARFDLPVMVLAAVALIPIARSGGRVSRLEGALLVCGYVVYLVLLLRGWVPGGA